MHPVQRRIVLAGFMLLASARWVPGEDAVGVAPPPAVGPAAPAYSASEAAADSYRWAEAQRRHVFERQVWSNATAQWYAGWPSPLFPPGLDAAYAYPPPTTRAMRPAPLGAYRSYPGVFEPWPVVPGDIYGMPSAERVAQPAGHEIAPDGRGGYVYRPVYPWQIATGESVPDGAATTESNPPANPLPTAPESIPTPLPETGPREF